MSLGDFFTEGAQADLVKLGLARRVVGKHRPANERTVGTGFGQGFRWFGNHMQKIHRLYAQRVSLDVEACVVNTDNPARAAYIAHINSAAARAWRRLR